MNGILSSSVPDGAVTAERGLCRSQHITVAKVQLRHHRNKLSSRPVSLPAERILGIGKVEENNNRNITHQGLQKGGAFTESIEEVDEGESAKVRAASHNRRTFIDTQTLRRTWDKQYKLSVASRTAKSLATSPADGTAGDAAILSTSVPSALSHETSSGTIRTIYPNRPYTVAVRPSRTLRRDDNVTKYGTVSTAFRAPRTLQPPPGTFYKPPSRSKAKALPNSASTNSAEEEEDDDEEEEDDEAEELGIEIEVSVDEPAEEDHEGAQEPMSLSPSSSPEDLDQIKAKPVYQRLRSRRLLEVENREAHFV